MVLQEKDRLPAHVYEYLHHIGAGEIAENFIKEIKYEGPVQIGESPGFLKQWWDIFYPIYFDCTNPPSFADPHLEVPSLLTDMPYFNESHFNYPTDLDSFTIPFLGQDTMLQPPFSGYPQFPYEEFNSNSLHNQN